MPQKGIIYRVLIASPSDCVKERSAIPEIIYSWNSVHSFHTSTILEPVMWETHVIPASGDRPQELINKQIVDSCDFLIGAFWTRIGTSTGDHVSGTAEEIDRLRKQGKQIFLYFSSAPVVPESIDSDQYKALIEYKEKFRGQGITFDYSDISEFRDMVQRHLSSLMAAITKDNEIDRSEVQKNNSEIEMFKSQFQAFLRKFEAEWHAERDSEPHSIEDAQYIISSALDELLHYRSLIAKDPENKLIPIFTEALKAMKELGRHQLYLDGGRSFRKFWEKGDLVVEQLQKLPLLMNNEMLDVVTDRGEIDIGLKLPKWLTGEDVVKYYNLSQDLLKQYIRNGLPVYPPGNEVLDFDDEVPPLDEERLSFEIDNDDYSDYRFAKSDMENFIKTKNT